VTRKPDEAVGRFLIEARKAFAYLTTDYGFAEHAPTLPDEPFLLELHSAALKVLILGIHWGAGVDVRLGRLRPESWETNQTYSLEDLIRLRAPEQSLLDARGFAKTHDQTVQLKHYGATLRSVGQDVLTGDAAVFRDLHAVIEKRRTTTSV
jgi:hypothetical protein